jgi:hypothetical protein
VTSILVPGAKEEQSGGFLTVPSKSMNLFVATALRETMERKKK